MFVLASMAAVVRVFVVPSMATVVEGASGVPLVVVVIVLLLGDSVVAFVDFAVGPPVDALAMHVVVNIVFFCTY